MKYIIYTLFGLLILLTLSMCKQRNHVKEYYIISKHDSTDFSGKNSKGTTLPIPPPPPLPFDIVGSEYSNIVIILDSTDVVYIYQTENSRKEIYNNDNNKRNIKDSYAIDFYSTYDTYIGLRPEHLIKFDSKEFINFIKNNNDIFQLDTNTQLNKLLFIGSNKDTVKNPALYDIVKLITNKINKKRNRIAYMVRKTTEEENNVIYCKRRNIHYDPSKFKWSKKYYGNSPLSKEYDSITNCYIVHLRPRLTFKIDTLKFGKRTD